MTSDRLKLGIIGLGIMGERLMRAALAHPGTDVVAVWDPSDAAVGRLAGITGDVTMSGSVEQVIAAAEAVYVASPPDSHIALGQAALAAGKALFLEKPLASDVPAARAFVAGAQGQRAAVNFPMASSPTIAQLRRWRPEIGRIERIEIRAEFAGWPRGWQKGAASWLSKRADGGFTREVVSHFLFLAQRWGGPLRLAEASVTYPEGDGSETAIAARLWAGDVPVALTGSVGTTRADEHNLTTIIGSKGQLRLRDWSYAEKLEADGQWRTAPDAMPNAEMRPLTLAGQLDKLAALARGEETELASLAEALSVMEAVEGILAS
ncbi:Gfo/Idh/MocA family oxidoreductase [Roseococcus sp. SYP-B2431]|uniref:Gfo/Idh/MocA family protein n=1 Tax=Roseococcus sp. SYP-B2431 TaxID=2496640 RepID=UPI001038B902|nr:Gfo/Idh/MocA family oxidoreductase [Roseococcus sp. SYP-B2431]TCI00325.1 Gfo/Idh/MocA family oxidoreductase [Roseococcus sp. SYP-B2431]